MSDSRDVLERVARNFEPVGDGLGRVHRRAEERQRRRRLSAAAIAIVLAAGGIGLSVVVFRGSGVEPATRRANGPIIFVGVVAPHDHRTALFAVDSLGSSPRRITNDLGADGFPTVSPDGSRIAYIEQTRSQGPPVFPTRYAIAVIGLDGSGRRLLYTCPLDGCRDLAWSPDGSEIAFVQFFRRADKPLTTMDVVTVDSGRVRVVCGQTCGTTPGEPSWSPDGRFLAVSQREANAGTVGPPPPSAIWIVRSDGVGARAITGCDAARRCFVDESPIWSPDGTEIAFNRFPLPIGAGDRPGVFLARVDGSGLRRLWTCHTSFCPVSAPAWSPDGTQLAVASDAIRAVVTVIPVDGRGPHDIVPCSQGSCGSVGAVTWAPDGTHIAFATSNGKSSSIDVAQASETMAQSLAGTGFASPDVVIWARG